MLNRRFKWFEGDAELVDGDMDEAISANMGEWSENKKKVTNSNDY